ncbi:MAG: DNA methyltransferase, partial [Acidobacteriota bacterium]
SQNFCGLINFKSMSALSQEGLAQVYDDLIWYARDKQRTKFRPLFVSQDVSEDKAFRFIDYPQSVAGYRRLSDEEFAALDRHDLSKVFRRSVLTSSGFTPSCTFEFEYHGIICRPFGKKSWRTTREGVQQLIEQNRLFILGDSPYFKQYYSDFPYMQLDNSWSDTAYASGRIYVVQTSPKVVQRCVLMTTDPGDLVLDPTCGSGTTAYVAEQWGRRWITIDTSRVPLALARQRLLTATFAYYELRDPARGPAGGFVYKRRQNQKGEEVGGIIPHITLRSIAQNEPTQEEVLVDRPEVESGVVRVSGPFVVEATIPTAIEVEPVRVAMEGEAAYEADPIGRMIEVLRRSPTLRLAGNQTVTLKNIRRPAKAMDLHAEAELAELTLEDLAEEAAKQKSLDMKRGKPVAFIFGPEHGPVTEQMVFSAAKEAYLKNYTHLFVIGFAIQPGASKLIQSCEQAVGLPATYVQATMDLLMQDLLKTTRASQVFSVTGSPDVRLIRLKRKNGNGPLYQVELLGLDVFDPVTMQTTHHKGDDLPAWFLDTDYDDLVFHVSQAFFPRTSAWDNLKRSLKGVYEESVWEHLAGTLSEPFSAGEYRKIAVKVIDDRGNELMVVKVLEEAGNER